MNGPGTVSNRTQVQVPIDQNETIYIDTVKPNVFNIALANLQTSTAVDVEKFLGGIPNQTLKVKSTGAVTLKHDIGGDGSIILNTSADKVLTANRIYNFTYVNDKWYEQDDSATGGGGGTTVNPLTINDSNAGGASPQSFDGGSPITISANTVGAVALSNFVALGDAEWVQLSGIYNDPSWLNSLAYSKLTGAPSLSGYVVGPASATDKALVRYNLTTGKLVQDSGLFLSDANIFSAATLSTANSVPFTLNATNALLTLIGRGVTIKPGAINPLIVRSSGDTADFISTAGDRLTVTNAMGGQLRLALDSFFYLDIEVDGSGIANYNITSTNPLHFFKDPIILGTFSTAADVGNLRLDNVQAIAWRNAANTANFQISLTASDNLEITAPLLITGLSGVGSRMVVADATGLLSTAAIPLGDVVGPASSIDNNLAAFNGVTGKLLEDSLIPLANVIVSSGSYVNPAWITSLPWSKITATPTTLAGYAISDAQPLDADLTAIAALGFTSAAFMRKTAANTYDLVAIDRLPLFASAITGVPSVSTYLRGDGSWAAISGSGDVVGPASATDTAIALFDGTTGKLLKNSTVTIAASGSTVINSAGVAIGLKILHPSGGAANFSMQYDASNRGDIFISSNGNIIWDAVGSSAYSDFNSNGILRFRLRGDIVVNENHGALWIRSAAFASNYTAITLTDNAVGSVSFDISAGSAPLFTFVRNVLISPLAGVGIRMVTADATGLLSTAAIPGGSVTVSSASIAFTDGDTARRVTIADAAVTAISKILLSITRPNITAEDDPGLMYNANVVSRGAGTFDVFVICSDISGTDPVESPPNETITLYYTVA